ncbi:ComEA family DNA-binding protein [Curtobacterium sp. VKM Ac-2922]|uniref:ComEA family DNA-binding protein n=1 Tax=Curtobacterium sp. VKM Ac-2922 TaxID=2929475 RepID=UPI001FB4163C|nr:ComEA family DNA-binding protein [Curtobacterium sp. VKM Ac-2922]MCJ1712628.1 ComEA family DNA-binding protein [Curtobacterium sp. VKM Ac-2922]
MSRFTLSPRAAIVLSAVVVVVALLVIVLGARGSDAGGTVSVSGAAPVSPGPSGSSHAGDSPSGGGSGSGGGVGGTSGPPSGAASASATPVVVHVLGAVARSGLVSLPSGSRVADALDAAGGAEPDADLARLNLARALVDGERLYVPRVGETEIPAALDGDGGGGAPSPGGGGGDAATTVVDLNTADQAALETLPGIGPALAQRILAWRDAHGGFSSPRDLLEVSGIGDVRFAELQPLVRV